MPTIFFLFLIGIFVLIVFTAIFGERGPTREQVLGEFANKLGWQLDTQRDYGLRDRFPHVSQFHRGRDRYAHNQMVGEWSLGEGLPAIECLMGDYHYETTETKTVTRNGKTHTESRTVDHHFSYLLVRSPYPTPAGLKVRPEGFFDRVGAFLGFDDIDFESAEFSRKFHVSSEDKRFAYDVIHPRMMAYLLETRPDGFVVEEGWLCLTGGRWEPDQFERYLRWSAGFFTHWPRHLQST